MIVGTIMAGKMIIQTNIMMNMIVVMIGDLNKFQMNGKMKNDDLKSDVNLL